MIKLVQDIFGGSDVFMEFQHPSLNFEKSTRNVSFDVFVPATDKFPAIAFEYQGLQHYVDTELMKNADDVSNRDGQKRDLCEKVRIFLRCDQIMFK